MREFSMQRLSMQAKEGELDRDYDATMARKREKLYDAMIEYFGALIPAQYTRNNAKDDVNMIERSMFECQ